MKQIHVGVIGYGTVGRGTVQTLIDNRLEIQKRAGIDVVVSGVADTHIDQKMDSYLDQVPFLTKSADELINRTDMDVIVEVVGGTDITYDFIIGALAHKKHVVTANKALLAIRGAELISYADEQKCQLLFEASVGGGIPVLSVLKNDLSANKIIEINGIVNGTCNYILSRMEQEKLSYETALKEAQSLGYAEANPKGDVEGYDSAYKMIILAYLAYGVWVDIEQVNRTGISAITLDMIESTSKAGKRIKLLGSVYKNGDEVCVEVAPKALDKSVQIANVMGVYNGIEIVGDKVGSLFLQGQGAGSLATASAVVADIIKIGKMI